MDKRKWLWKRRSSEKSTSDVESLSSMSSQSERCSDDQDCSKASSTHNPQSPEVTSETVESNVQGSMEQLRHELSDVLSGCANHIPQLAEVTSNVRDTEIVNKCNGTAEHLNTDLSFTGDSPEDKVIKDDMPNGYVKLETKLDDVPSRDSDDGKEDDETVKLLTEKLSAALLNVSQKDDLVKQHSKVAEEAVAGWEKAENEAAAWKQQLEAAVQQKSTLEARVSHLDEALKECVRQLRLSRDEQDRKIKEAVAEKTHDWELVKSNLEGQIVQLQAQTESSTNSSDSELHYKLEYLETENAALKQELQLQSEELEVITIERDLSSKAAETASKQHLESIKKVAKLEAECRRLKALQRIVSSKNDPKSAALSCVESLADGQSENSETNIQKINGSALNRNMTSSSIEIDLMDDFLEMERLAALSESVAKPAFESENQIRNELELMIDRTAELEEKVKTLEEEKDEMERVLAQTNYCFEESQVQLIEAQMKVEQLEQKLQEMNELQQFLESTTLISNGKAQKMSSEIVSLTEEIKKERDLSAELSSKCLELQDELQRMKHELEEVQCGSPSIEELKLKDIALAESENSLQKLESRVLETEGKLKLLETQLTEAHQSKESLESELSSARAEVQTISAHIDSLQAQIEKEWALSAELSTKCRELENELEYKTQELDQQISQPKIEVKIKQEDLAVAAGKLAECQRTIASLGNQLNSLATLEDFLIDTASIPGYSPVGTQISSSGRDEPWQLHSNGTYMHRSYNGSEFTTHSSSSSDFLLSRSTSERSSNGFGRFP